MANINKVLYNIDQRNDTSSNEKQTARLNIGASQVSYDNSVTDLTITKEIVRPYMNTKYTATVGNDSFLLLPTSYADGMVVKANDSLQTRSIPQGLPTGGTAGQILILDENGDPIWTNNTYGSYIDTYNGNNKEVELNEMDLKGSVLTSGTDRHILTLKSTEFAGIGGNRTRFTEQYEMVPHNTNSRTSGFIFSDGFGLTKKDISTATDFTISWSTSTAAAETAQGLGTVGTFSAEVPANSLVFIEATLIMSVSVPKWDVSLLDNATYDMGNEILVSCSTSSNGGSSFSQIGYYTEQTIPAMMFNPTSHGHVISTRSLQIPVLFVYRTYNTMNAVQFDGQYIYSGRHWWYITSAQAVTKSAFYIKMEI